MIYINKVPYEGIISHIKSVTQELEETKKIYDDRWEDIFYIEQDFKKLKNFLKQTVNVCCKAYGSFSKPKKEADEEMVKVCQSIDTDLAVTDLMCKFNLYMEK